MSVSDSFAYHIKMHDFYEDILGSVEKSFGISGYNKGDARPLGKNRLMPNEGRASWKIMTESVALRVKTYTYKHLDVKKSDKI